MKSITLDGIWSLAPQERHKTLPATRFFHRQHSLLLTLPGDIHTALYEAKIIEDPYSGETENAVQWVSSCDWVASKGFIISAADVKGKKAILSMTMVDTCVEVVINDRVVGSCNNQFRRWKFDCTEALVVGENFIELRFSSPQKEASKLASQLPYPLPYTEYKGSCPHRNLIRKSQSHSGWDGGPCLQTMGIYETITLDFIELGYVESVTTTTTTVSTGWHVAITIIYEAYHLETLSISAEIASVTHTAVQAVEPGKNVWVIEFDVKKVEPWMPVGYGKPHLHPLTLTVGESVIEKKIGFRTVELTRTDSTGMMLSVNGQPIFCKGANWVPLDALPSRLTPARTAQLLQDALDANMNMVRVWGGGIYEYDHFYTLCDEMGLLVWQDCMFSSATYPATDSFLANVEAELRYQIQRLHDHPSLVLWCGNDKGLETINSQENKERYIFDYNRLNTHTIERLIKELDPTRPFWPSSPTDPSEMGDTHHWDMWQEGKPFESIYETKPHFASAFGYQSIPSLATIALYAADEQRNLSSPDMEHHQRYPKGNTIMLESISRYFRFPEGFASMIYLSQVQQALAMKMAVEYWRTLRPYCMGTLYFQLNSSWPGTTWSSIEYSGKWKLLHYATKHFYAPILPILYRKDDVIELFVVNDTTQSIDCRISVKIRRFDGTKVTQHVFLPHVAAEQATHIVSFPASQLPIQTNEAYMHVKLSTKNLYLENSLFLDHPKHCALQDPQIRVDVDTTQGGFLLNLSSHAPAFYVALDAGSLTGTFTQNMFELRPTANKTIRFKAKEEITLEEFKKQLSIQDLYTSYQMINTP